MRIEIRGDSVLLDGYVNVVDRYSKPIRTANGKFIEKIEPKAFQRALGRAENVDLLLNHNKDRKLGSTKQGNIDLFEDNIGLRAICTVTDPEVVEKARNNKLRGWSFGFYSNEDSWEGDKDQLQKRSVKDLDLTEVSIIDDRMSPIYIGTSIEKRGEEEVVTETRQEDFRAVIDYRTNVSDKKVDKYYYENLRKRIKREC